MAKINFQKGLGLVGGLIGDINDKFENDGKIDALEIIDIGSNLLNRLDLEQDDETETYISMAKELVSWLQEAKADKKITITEIVAMATIFAEELGYDFDTTGITIQ